MYTDLVAVEQFDLNLDPHLFATTCSKNIL